jgi:hypothetical protein
LLFEDGESLERLNGGQLIPLKAELILPRKLRHKLPQSDASSFVEGPKSCQVIEILAGPGAPIVWAETTKMVLGPQPVQNPVQGLLQLGSGKSRRIDPAEFAGRVEEIPIDEVMNIPEMS